MPPKFQFKQNVTYTFLRYYPRSFIKVRQFFCYVQGKMALLFYLWTRQWFFEDVQASVQHFLLFRHKLLFCFSFGRFCWCWFLVGYLVFLVIFFVVVFYSIASCPSIEVWRLSRLFPARMTGNRNCSFSQ